MDKLVGELSAQLAPKRVTLELTPAARAWLAEHGYDRANGARPMGRLIDRSIRRRVADELLFGALQHGGAVTVDEAAGELVLACRAAEPAAKPPREGAPAPA